MWTNTLSQLFFFVCGVNVQDAYVSALADGSSPPSVWARWVGACWGRAAPPGPRKGRRVRPAGQQRSWRWGSLLERRPGLAGCWRWTRPRQARTARPTRPPGSSPAVGTGSVPGTCSGGGPSRCCPACPRWWWEPGERTGPRRCGRHLGRSRTEQVNKTSHTHKPVSNPKPICSSVLFQLSERGRETWMWWRLPALQILKWCNKRVCSDQAGQSSSAGLHQPTLNEVSSASSSILPQARCVVMHISSVTTVT